MCEFYTVFAQKRLPVAPCSPDTKLMCVQGWKARKLYKKIVASFVDAPRFDPKCFLCPRKIKCQKKKEVCVNNSAPMHAVVVVSLAPPGDLLAAVN